jgi:DNA polymerase III alpha subunit
MTTPYAELHCHTHFSFLDGASPPDELVARAVELGLSGLAVTDHNGLYGVVRFATAAAEAGLRPVIGVEIELADAAAPDPAGVVVPPRRRRARGGAWPDGRQLPDALAPAFPSEGVPARPRPDRARLPGYRDAVKEDLRGVGEGRRGPHLVLLARNAAGYRSLCRMVSRANLAGTKSMPRFTQQLLAENAEGLVALSGCRDSEIARRLLVGDRDGARAVAERYALLFAARKARRDSPATSSFFLELQHHLLPDDDWLVAETTLLAEELSLPVVVTNDVHYTYPEGRELHDVLTAIHHGRTLDELRDLRRPDGESYLKGAAEMLALPPGTPPAGGRDGGHSLAGGSGGSGGPGGSGGGHSLAGGQEPAATTADSFLRLAPTGSGTQDADARTSAAWAEGISNTGELAASCSVDLGFERYRFPGFPVPKGHTPFSYLEELCHDGARRRYHPMSSPVVKQLAHELDVIERTGLAEFFLICWDIMRFAKSRGIPAQGRGSAADSIVAYVLGITRVDPIRHNLLFERFINEGRTSYPDVDIDFSSERREEVIQYVYGRYGAEHTGMVCNLVTYRARSAVREVGYALGFPRPLVDRVAKALETYDSVMVRRDLEADGGFGQFFAATVERETAAENAAALATATSPDAPEVAPPGDRALTDRLNERGLVDRMGQLNHPRGGRISTPTEGALPPGRGSGSVRDTHRESGEDSAVPEPALEERSGEAGGRVPRLPDPFRVDVGSNSAVRGRQSIDQRPGARSAAFADGTAATYDSRPGYLGESGEVPASGPLRPRFLRNTGPGGVIEKRNGGGALWVGLEGAIGSNPETAGRVPPESGDPGPAQAASGTEPAAYYRPHRYPGDFDADGGATIARGRANGLRAPVPIADLGGGSALEQQRRIAKRRAIGSDDEGGPGDSAASIAWLAAERAGKAGWALAAATAEAAAPAEAAPTAQAAVTAQAAASQHATPEPAHPTGLQREPHSSVARVAPQPPMPEDVRRGSTAKMPDWERWLAFCARIDGFPRHLSIHSGGMLVTAAPLIDIAPLERATMPDRVVVQFDKRDVETIKLIKLDLLGLGMLAAIDETLQLIEHDCAACVDLDRIPEDVPEVFEMLRAADTVGVFQVESRAQMQTLPKSRPATLDDLVVEVAIIRPGPIQGNAVHPYLRRRQGLEPTTFLHPSLAPVLRETLGVILYQEQVMQIAITVAGFTAGESDGFRRAMGTWRSSKEMEKLHARFVDGCRATNGLTTDQAEELFRQVAAFASFGFAKSHAAAFARTAYESAFLKLFYPAQFTVGLINAQPMGFYPVEVLINDAKRHGVAVLPVDINASVYKTATEWVGPDVQRAVRSSGCIVPSLESRRHWSPDQASGYGIRLGLHLVKGIGDEQAERLDAELARGPYRTLADVVARTELSEEVIERVIRAGALDSLERPRRELLWQLREVMGAVRAAPHTATGGRMKVDGIGKNGVGEKHARSRMEGRASARGAAGRPDVRVERAAGVGGRAFGGRSVQTGPTARARGGSSMKAAGRPMDLRLPPTPAPELPSLTERERLGDSYAILNLDAHRQVVSLFRPALDKLGAVTNASLADRGPGPVRLGGLVVTRQHPMTARGTVFLALEDETGMVNVTLWPDTWARLRGVVRRHALLYVEGVLQREANVVNVVARDVKSLPDLAERVGGPTRPEGVRALGYSGMRRGG